MEIQCPKCGSHDLTADKKGFSGKKAVAGAILTGGVGLLAGTIGSNKIMITCLKCGTQFSPGQDKESAEIARKTKLEENERIRKSTGFKAAKIILIVLFALLGLIVLLGVLLH